ncbi:MAG: O-antigen ligase family protein [Bacteroidetes bacterium]|nr:O-antigen ligase family protein [Bacteroidota bacterium]
MQLISRENNGLKWLYGSVAVFALIALTAIVNEFYWLLLFPVALLVVVTGIFRVDYLMYFAVIVTPLSINLAKTGLGIGISLPSEPIIFGTMLLFITRQFYDSTLTAKIITHPISLAILFHLLWMMVTTLTSSMPIVSFKATFARFWFVAVYYFLAILVFRNIKNIKVFVWCYVIPLLVVITYTTINHAMAGFTEKAAHTSMVPFYNDHTAYAALIAMFIPLMFGFIADKTSAKSVRIWSFIVLLIFITAIILSYTRASWISLVAALLCYLVFLLRIKTYVVVSGITLVVGLFLFYQTDIIMSLEQNEKESSTDYASHVQSMSNISTDASNVERINRWHSAFRMFDERPWFGWGPGTYMFEYAPFQKWSEKTIISTNFGEGGNAHSEYIGPLAEQGIMGPIVFILIGALVIFRASRMIIYSDDKHLKMLVKGLILGLITYWVHGMLNNFLDTEKASVPFWGFIGAIVALEIYHYTRVEHSQEKKNTLNP